MRGTFNFKNNVARKIKQLISNLPKLSNNYNEKGVKIMIMPDYTSSFGRNINGFLRYATINYKK